MSIDLSSQFTQFLNVSLPKTESVVFDAAIAHELRYCIDCIRLHAHTYSITHNLTHGSLKLIHALEFAYQHELHSINNHVDDGGEYSLTQKKPKQLTQNITYNRRLMLRTFDQRANRNLLEF
jgi:hypothetical protein